jgi:hypothetical protein
MLTAAPEGFSPHAAMSMATLLATVSARSQAPLLPLRAKMPVIVALRVPLVLETGPTLCASVCPAGVVSSCCRLAQAGQRSAEAAKNARAVSGHVIPQV